jgi:hypothetical protein
MKKKIFLLCVLFVGQSFAIVTGQALVDAARRWIGCPYCWEYPRNTTWKGEKGLDGFFWYGVTWKIEDLPPLAFDCSGLVSYCAELRRHYAADMDPLFGVEHTPWEVAEPGDIIRKPGHFMILSVNEPELHRLYVVHAPGAGLTVREEIRTYKWLSDNDAHARLFKVDNTGPEIVVTGVVDGGVYLPPVNFNYFTNDPNEEAWARFFEGNYLKETKLTQTGDYTLRIYAKDWAENLSDRTIHFRIIGPPQVIFTDPSQGEENVDIYDFRKQKQKDIGDEFNFEVVFNKPMDTVSVCQAIKVVNVDKDSSPVLIKNIYWYDDRTILVRKFDLSFINRKNNKGV